MTKDTPLSELPKKLFAKKKGAATKPSSDKASGTETVRVNIKNERPVDIAKREVVVMAYLNQLKLFWKPRRGARGDAKPKLQKNARRK